MSFSRNNFSEPPTTATKVKSTRTKKTRSRHPPPTSPNNPAKRTSSCRPSATTPMTTVRKDPSRISAETTTIIPELPVTDPDLES